MTNIFKALSLGMYMLAWFERASKDGEIDEEEVVQCIQGAIETVGLKVGFKVTPASPTAPI